jgi:multicomponent Na+:H+ antiporter subunit D
MPVRARSRSTHTVLRAVARVFLGWGAAHDPALTSQPKKGHEEELSDEEETDRGRGGHYPIWALAAAVPLAVAGYCLAFAPDLAAHALKAAQDLQDHAAHAALVLHGTPSPPRPLPAYTISPSAWIYGAASTGGALVVAAAGLWWGRAPTWTRQALGALRRPVDALKAVHDGSVGDYATWLVTGTAALAVGWAATLH